MIMTENIKFFKGGRILILEQGTTLSKVSYEDTPEEDFWVKSIDISETNQKHLSNSKQNASFTQYLSYDENKVFFDSSDFSENLLINPFECYWLAGWFSKRGLLEKHDPVLVDGEVVRRGATLHVLFPNPEFPNLDVKVGEFFDPYRKGWIMINSVSAYKFFEEFILEQIPTEYLFAYEKGVAGNIL